MVQTVLKEKFVDGKVPLSKIEYGKWFMLDDAMYLKVLCSDDKWIAVEARSGMQAVDVDKDAMVSRLDVTIEFAFEHGRYEQRPELG